MIQLNEKAGRGGNPIRPNTQSLDTKTISFNRRKINGKRDYASEKFHLLKLHAGIRFNDLGRLASYRRRHGLELGTEAAWAAVLANLSECFGVSADAFSINQLARRLGLPAIDPDVAAAASRPADGLIMPSHVAGKLLQVLSSERTDAKVRSLEAIDETVEERKRRLSRERQRKRRSVTRPYNDRLRDTRRRTASPALRALHSSSAVRLPSRHEPQRLSFPSGEKVRGAQQKASETCRAVAPQARLADPKPPVCPRFDRPLPLTRSAIAIPHPRRRNND